MLQMRQKTFSTICPDILSKADHSAFLRLALPFRTLAEQNHEESKNGDAPEASPFPFI